MGRSRASRKGVHSRRVCWLKWRSQRYDLLPEDRIWIVADLCLRLQDGSSSFGRAMRSMSVSTCSGRQRDLFPIALISGRECKPDDVSTQRWGLLSLFVNTVLFTLNFLYCGPGGRFELPPRNNAAQCDVVSRTVSGCVDFIRRLDEPKAGTWEGLIPVWGCDIGANNTKAAVPLVAAMIDNLECAGLLNPLRSLPCEYREIVINPKRLFPDTKPGEIKVPPIDAKSRPEYVQLVSRQLRSNKLGLTFEPAAGGVSFGIGKRGSVKMREVWHGAAVSTACLPPPVPPHLLSPTALAFLQCDVGSPFRLSKRDARCWFDQVRLPEQLQRWMCKPAVTSEELERLGGIPRHEQVRYLLDGETWKAGIVWHASKVWPMGFAWSSYVAQCQLLDICAHAGLGEDLVVACDMPLPSSPSLCFGAATDDVVILSRGDVGTCAEAAARIDRAFEEAGATRNTSKDITDVLDGECVGVSLENGTGLAVPPVRVLSLAWVVRRLLQRKFATPAEVESISGTLHWYDLLNRPKLSCYRYVYKYVQGAHPVDAPPPFDEVAAECRLGLLLGIYWRIDLTRNFVPFLSAADASTSFGFGVSTAPFPEDLLWAVARWSEKQGAYVLLNEEFPQKSRLGAPLHLELRLGDFKDVSVSDADIQPT